MKAKQAVSAIFIVLIFFSCAHVPDLLETEDEAAASAVPAETARETGQEIPEPPGEEGLSAPEPTATPPAPFTRAEIDARIVNLVYPGTLPVTRNGAPLAVYPDLDGNGYRDACVLCVKDLEPGEAVFEVLSDPTKIFDEVLTPFSCSIQFFLQKNGKLYRSRIAPLGRKLVLESFRTLWIGDDPSLPTGAVAVFKSRGGTEQEWAIFNGGRISRFTFQESLSIIPVIDDINGDGVIDVVVHHQGFEEGRGYETFLIWYNWNGSDYVEYRSTNIVRNLNSFIDSAVENLLSSDWEAFIRESLSEEDRERLHAKGLTSYTMLPEIFDCDSNLYEEFLIGTEEPGAFVQVVFPDFYETPFSREDTSRFEIPVQVRFVTGTNQIYLCSAVIYMNRNPFEGRQFGFRVRGD